jgi:hypothetical protein
MLSKHLKVMHLLQSNASHSESWTFSIEGFELFGFSDMESADLHGNVQL